jgi:hypothetical protein
VLTSQPGQAWGERQAEPPAVRPNSVSQADAKVHHPSPSSEGSRGLRYDRRRERLHEHHRACSTGPGLTGLDLRLGSTHLGLIGPDYTGPKKAQGRRVAWEPDEPAPELSECWEDAECPESKNESPDAPARARREQASAPRPSLEAKVAAALKESDPA